MFRSNFLVSSLRGTKQSHLLLYSFCFMISFSLEFSGDLEFPHRVYRLSIQRNRTWVSLRQVNSLGSFHSDLEVERQLPLS